MPKIKLNLEELTTGECHDCDAKMGNVYLVPVIEDIIEDDDGTLTIYLIPLCPSCLQEYMEE